MLGSMMPTTAICLLQGAAQFQLTVKTNKVNQQNSLFPQYIIIFWSRLQFGILYNFVQSLVKKFQLYWQKTVVYWSPCVLLYSAKNT